MVSIKNVFILVLFSYFIIIVDSSKNRTSSSTSNTPILYNLKNGLLNKVPVCSKTSPEIFFHNIAEPSLSLLYHRCKALFGILMDEIEASYSNKDFSEDLKNKTREQWSFIAERVTASFDSAVDRLEAEWEYFILINDVHPLPWEATCKLPLLYETLSRIEYGYLMVEAVIKSGIKEIVGTLHNQLADVIKKIEKDMARESNKNEEVTELRLLKRTKQVLSKMDSSFSTNLLLKVINKALEAQKGTKTRASTFISDSMDQMAILFHAFREKGNVYYDFWSQMSQIFEKEFKISHKLDIQEHVEMFMLSLMKDQDRLLSLIIELVSRDS